MGQEDHPDSISDGGLKLVSRENVGLRSGLEMYRWLFWAVLFAIIVLVVAQCAHHRQETIWTTRAYAINRQG